MKLFKILKKDIKKAANVLEENIIVWFWIGSHDDYDRLLK